MLFGFLKERREPRLSAFDFARPFFCKLSGLDFGEHFFHARARGLVDDARAAGEIAGAEAEPSAAELTGHFLRLLVERRRVALLPEIAAALRDMLDLHQGVIRARVTTAVPLLAAEREMIEAKLRSLVGAQRVELDEQVTRSIQGGVIIHVAGKVIDASVRSYLESLRENLRRVRVSEFSGDRMLALDYARLRDEARAADAG